MTYEEIVRALRDSTYELENEGRQVRAGLKEEQDTAAIIQRYAWLYSEEALATVEAASGEERQRVRATIIQGMVEKRTAAQEDRLTSYYASAKACLDGEELPFYSALAQTAREPEASRREALGEGTYPVMEQADQLALERNGTVMEVLRELGYDSYVRFFSDLKQVDYSQLRAELERVSDAARDLYRAWVEPRMESTGHHFGDTPQSHMSFIRGLPEHDPAFSVEHFEPAMRRTFRDLGLPLFEADTIHIDLEDRPAKNPRASVWVPEAGREVHLLMRPQGGNHDYSAFLHESGHALHYGLADPGIGWPLANVSRSMAYPELWSFLAERIGHEPEWIAESTGVGAAEAERISADLVGVDLMLFMRYVGKLGCELDLYAGDPLDVERGRALFAGLPSARTGFVYDPRAWQYDRDPGFYSADYLRAWLAQAELELMLRDRFGARWWASKEAGEWLRAQWRRGCEPEAEELVAEMHGRPWSGDALLQRLQHRLGAA
ncbi:MAG: hypothetical protein J2P45_05305 [Candidatus Dormibacteraeota bacterium]|nr:hypothetical protein [Candidatus Dormibacteraeota bacterium]